MAITQDQVDAWFDANPNATADDVAAVVQSIGGLEANAGLADMIGNRYSIGADEVSNYYNNYVAPPSGLSSVVADKNSVLEDTSADTSGASTTSQVETPAEAIARIDREQKEAARVANANLAALQTTQTTSGLSNANLIGTDTSADTQTTYTQEEVNQALADTLAVDPNASKADILTAAADLGITAEQVEAAYSGLDTSTTSGLSSVQETAKQDKKTIQLQGQNFDIDTAVADKLADQIIGQGLTSKWKGEGFGSAEANAKNMAEQLAAAGITDINQVGMIDKKVDAAVQPVYDSVLSADGQEYVTQIVGYVDADGNSVDPSLVKASTDYGGESGFLTTSYVAPIGTQKVIGNKITGQELIKDYDGGDSATWSGTYAGKGNTAYKVQFDAQGKPYFYTTAASSNDLKKMMDDLGPLGQVALAVATGGLSIPEQIAANMAVKVLSGDNIGDAIKSAAISYAGAQIPGLDALKEGTSFIKDLGLSPELTKTLTNSFQNAAVSGGTALLSGQDVGKAMLKGAVAGGTNGAVDALMGNIEGFSDLTPAQRKMATNAVSGIISGQPLDQIVINTAIAAANAEVAKAKGVSQVATTKVGDGTSTPTTSGLDSLVNKEIASALTIDASDSKDVNSAAKFAQAQGYDKFTFGGKTYNIEGNQEAKIADLEKTVKADITAANLKGGEFDGLDKAITDATKRNTVVLGNDEVATLEEAAALAKLRDPTASQFTIGGQTYTMGASSSAVDTALSQAKVEELKNNIANAPSRSEAYKLARDALGAGQTFTWDGKSYSTNTAEEAQKIATAQGDALSARNLGTATNASRTVAAQSDTGARATAAEELTKQQANANKTIQSSGFFSDLANTIQNQMKLSSEAANDYLKNNPKSPITNSVSTAYEAAGNLQKNVAGGLALMTDNKPLADAFVKSGNDLTKLGQSIGNGVEDTKNWNETTSLIQNAKGWEKLGIIAGRIMDGNSGLGRQVEVELRQELPGLFLGGGTVKGIMLATGAMDTAETAGNAALDAYDDAVKKGATHKDALSSARTAGAVAGATEAAVQLTLGKLADFGAGKISNVAGKGTAKVVGEGVVEGGQEAGAGAAVDLALGNAMDANKYITQGVLGTAVGKGTAVATSPTDIATSETINNNISTAVAAGDTAGVNSAISNSVQQSLNSGASVSNAVSTSVNSAISNGADANASISTAVSTAIQNGSDVSQTVTASIDSAISAGVTSSQAINTAVSSAVSSGADVNQVINSAVTSAITAGSNTNLAINNAVSAAIGAGANVNSAVTSAVTTAINGGANANTSVAAAVNSAITSGVNSTTAINAAVQAAVSAGVDVNTAINTAVTTAANVNANTNANANVNANANTNANANAATNANVNANANANANANTNANANANANTNANANVNANVNANTNANANTNVNANTIANTNVTADTNVNTNPNVTANTNTVSNLPTTNVSSVTSNLPTTNVLTVPTTTTSPLSTVTATPTVSTPTTSTPTKGSQPPPKKTAKKSSPSTWTEPKLDSSPQFLKGAPKEKAMQLASLKQIYNSLTPEMQEIFAEQGITPPDEEISAKESEKESDKESEKDTDKKKKKSDREKTYEEFLAEQEAELTPEEQAARYGTKFVASGGSVFDSMTPKYIESAKSLTAAPVPGTGGVDAPLKLAGLKHLKQGIAKPPRAMGEYAQGGLPTKYAKAAPKGHNPEFITGLTGFYAQGKGTGQSDDIPAMLHDGDYVIDADAVAALGDGSSKAGAQALSQFQTKVPHKMSSGGQAVPAKIADGEYVFPAAFVTALGGGDNKQGSKLLDAMREELRAHKRSAPTSKIPPKAKSPLDYLRMAKG